MSEWKEFLEEQLKDPVIRTEWDALEPEFAIIQAILHILQRICRCMRSLMPPL